MLHFKDFGYGEFKCIGNELYSLDEVNLDVLPFWKGNAEESALELEFFKKLNSLLIVNGNFNITVDRSETRSNSENKQSLDLNSLQSINAYLYPKLDVFFLKLQQVLGDVKIHNKLNMPELKYIGGSCSTFSDGEINAFNLKFVNGLFEVKGCFPSLTSVGGDFKAEGSFPSLVSVGGDFSAQGYFPNLRHVRGSVCDLGNLSTPQLQKDEGED